MNLIFSALLLTLQAPSGQIRDINELRYEIALEEAVEAKIEAAEALEAAIAAQETADDAQEFINSARTIISLIGYFGGPGVILTGFLSYLGYKRFHTK